LKVTLVESPFGVLAFNEENELVTKALFSKKPQEAAKAFQDVEAGKLIDEVGNMIEALKDEGYDTFVFEKASLAKSVEARFGIKVEVAESSPAGESVRSNSEKLALKTGFSKNAKTFNSWMREFTVETTKLRVKGAIEKRDLVVAQAIQTLDELDKTINMLMARVREWYGIHFPELDRLCSAGRGTRRQRKLHG
jgi:nucleolar protein 56